MRDETSSIQTIMAQLATAPLSVCLVTHTPRVGANRGEAAVEEAWQVSMFRGKGDVTLGDRSLAVDGPTIAVIPPGVAVAASQNGEDLACLNLQFSIVSGELKLPALTLDGMLTAWSERLERDFQIILEDWQMPDPGARESLNARAKSLLMDVLRLWSQNGADAVSPAIVETACRFMAVQYGEALTVREVAEHCGVRADSLCRAFRRHLNISPRGYLQELRLKQARNLLLAGMSVTDVAEQTGFGSVHYFSRAFKRAEGASPTDWRKRQGSSSAGIAVAADTVG